MNISLVWQTRETRERVTIRGTHTLWSLPLFCFISWTEKMYIGEEVLLMITIPEIESL
jgi:hypothetical protein